MATIKAVIVPGKALKGGRHKVRVSLSHNGDFRYILTDIIIESEKQFKNGCIVKRPDASFLNTKLRKILNSYQKVIDGLEGIASLSCADLLRIIERGGVERSHTMKSLYEEYMTTREMSDNTRLIYSNIFNLFGTLMEATLPVSAFCKASVLAFEEKLRTRRLGNSSRRMYHAFLRTLLHYAVNNGYAQYRIFPYTGFTLPSLEVRDSWLSADEIRAMRDFTHKSKSLMLAKDLFMLSYYLGGINMADIRAIDFRRNMKTIKYRRKKLGARGGSSHPVEFEIPTEAREIIARRIEWLAADGKEYARLTNHRHFMSYNMGRISEELSMPKLIFYSARKSFSQHALMLGVDLPTLDYILGHSHKAGGQSIYHYIYVTPDMATAAVRRVLDNLAEK